MSSTPHSEHPQTQAPPWISVVRLEESHKELLENFSSNEESIDHWLQHSACEQSAQLRTSTWLCLDAQGKICAFFSLAMSIVTAPYEKLSNTQRKRWGIDERGFAPAILIAKLGLHHEYHGKGHGSDLIDAALNKCVETAPRCCLSPYSCRCTQGRAGLFLHEGRLYSPQWLTFCPYDARSPEAASIPYQ